jgi:hypothetical protein
VHGRNTSNEFSLPLLDGTLVLEVQLDNCSWYEVRSDDYKDIRVVYRKKGNNLDLVCI